MNKNNQRLGLAAAAAVVALIALSAGCKKGGGQAAPGGPGAPPAKSGNPASPRNKSGIAYPVEVQPVEVRSLVYTVAAVGSIEAFEKVQVTARVAGSGRSAWLAGHGTNAGAT